MAKTYEILLYEIGNGIIHPFELEAIRNVARAMGHEISESMVEEYVWQVKKGTIACLCTIIDGSCDL